MDVDVALKRFDKKAEKLIIHDPIGQPAGDNHQFLFGSLEGEGQLFVMAVVVHQGISGGFLVEVYFLLSFRPKAPNGVCYLFWRCIVPGFW